MNFNETNDSVIQEINESDIEINEVSPTTFSSYPIDRGIVEALDKMGYISPTPVQEATLPLILEKKDLIVLAQTGSGKTAACAIPICNNVHPDKSGIKALIVVPTRELALQYATEMQKIGSVKKIKVFAIFGGETSDLQLSKLRHGVDVLVATPGRLIDFIYSRKIDLSMVETLILDEADEMLNLGFFDDLDFIIQCLVHPHQTLLFSATMSDRIKKIAQSYMQTPLEINLVQMDTTPNLIDHYFVYCAHNQRQGMLIKMLDAMQPKQAIIFCYSRQQVELVYRELRKYFQGVDFLHAGLSQDVRTIVTQKFRNQKIKFLIATDVVARGLDFSHITHVFNYQLSKDPTTYIHRSGRTGRYNRVGVSVSLVTKQEISIMNDIRRRVKKEVHWVGPALPSVLNVF